MIYSFQRSRLTTLVLAAWLAGLIAVATHAESTPARPPYNPYAGVLEKHGVKPTLVGVTAYLKMLVPDEATQAKRRAKAQQLIKQLGDSSFRQREAAMRELMALPDPPVDLLQEAAAEPDPEVSWRADMVLKNIDGHDPLPEAVLRTIFHLKIEGAANEILAVLPHLARPSDQVAALDALRVTVTKKDRPLLDKLIAGDDANLKLAAVKALGRIADDDDKERLIDLLDDGDAKVQLAAADALAHAGDRRVLPSLVKLLDDPDADVAVHAATLLRGLTGEQFGFIAYDKEVKTRSLAKWRRWLVEHGETAELNHPLKVVGAQPELGHTLVLIYTNSKLIEYDAAGKEIWRLEKLGNPWAIQRLPNGHTLLGSYRGKYVVEFDAEKREVWRVDKLPGGVFGAQRLPNGNTVLACHDSNKVVEVDRKGDIVWQHKFDKGQPLDAHRLPNGNTVVALYQANRVVEIDRDGKEVWEVAGLGVPRAVKRLPNGNTLVCDDSKNRIDEYNPAGKSVWSYTDLTSPYDMQRLANGNTLITDNMGIRIVTPDGETVWKKELKGVGRALRF